MILNPGESARVSGATTRSVCDTTTNVEIDRNLEAYRAPCGVLFRIFDSLCGLDIFINGVSSFRQTTDFSSAQKHHQFCSVYALFCDKAASDCDKEFLSREESVERTVSHGAQNARRI